MTYAQWMTFGVLLIIGLVILIAAASRDGIRKR